MRAKLKTELKAVRTAFARVKTSVQITELKSTRSRRTIALPAVAITALRSHRVRQLEARLLAGRRWQDRGFVFASSIGTPLELRNVTRQFKALLTAASLHQQLRTHLRPGEKGSIRDRSVPFPRTAAAGQAWVPFRRRAGRVD